MNFKISLTFLLVIISVSLTSHAAENKGKFGAEELKTKTIYSFDEEIPLDKYKDALAFAPFMQPFDITDTRVYYLRQTPAFSFVEFQRTAKKSILHTSRDDLRNLVVVDPNICVRKADQTVMCNGELVSSDLFGQCRIRGFYLQSRKLDAYSKKVVREAVLTCTSMGVATFETGNVDIEAGLNKLEKQGAMIAETKDNETRAPNSEASKVKAVEEVPAKAATPSAVVPAKTQGTLKVTAIENAPSKPGKDTF